MWPARCRPHATQTTLQRRLNNTAQRTCCAFRSWDASRRAANCSAVRCRPAWMLAVAACCARSVRAARRAGRTGTVAHSAALAGNLPALELLATSPSWRCVGCCTFWVDRAVSSRQTFARPLPWNGKEPKPHSPTTPQPHRRTPAPLAGPLRTCCLTLTLPLGLTCCSFLVHSAKAKLVLEKGGAEVRGKNINAHHRFAARSALPAAAPYTGGAAMRSAWHIYECCYNQPWVFCSCLWRGRSPATSSQTRLTSSKMRAHPALNASGVLPASFTLPGSHGNTFSSQTCLTSSGTGYGPCGRY